LVGYAPLLRELNRRWSMARGADEEGALEDALGHSLREVVIRQLWCGGEPTTATELQRGVPGSTLAEVSYHLLVLEGAGVVELAARSSPAIESVARRAYVVRGPNASEAARRLGLAT
jgi:DNA-binding transcriptional ArsR family regulator